MSETIDHKARAIVFHRRAQRAERDARAAAGEARHWQALWLRAARNRDTVKRRLKRTQARMQAFRHLDPLTRIIELGRLFP
jgi:transposase InsO family protein